nr:NADH dehydrogenase [ubiquinone] 1 alpha subcomplex subunit 13-B [Tanacetum cinerariifolium]
MLQAEEDERQVITSPDLLRFNHFDPVTVMHGLPWVMKYLVEEARIMKDVPGWKAGESVYHSGKWMSPATPVKCVLMSALGHLQSDMSYKLNVIHRDIKGYLPPKPLVGDSAVFIT